MKRLIALGFAVLLAMPAAAQAQDWKYADGGENGDCFALTFRGAKAFAVQGVPRDGSNEGAFIVLMSVGEVAAGSEDVIATFGVKGKWAGEHLAVQKDVEGTTTLIIPLAAFKDVDQLPDAFHFTVRKGSQIVLDADITEFKGAVQVVRKCVADR